MADKPSRSLVLLGDGFARCIDSLHTSIHSFTSRACCGFMTLPCAPPSESKNERVVRELAILLDADDAYQNMISGANASSAAPTISDRFMGMKAAIVTENHGLKSFCCKIGLAEYSWSNFNLGGDGAVSKLLALLGFEGGETLEASPFDLVVVHFEAGLTQLDRMNQLVCEVMKMAPPGSEVGSRLHVSIVMGFGDVTPADESLHSVLVSKHDVSPHLSKLYPRQSYTMKGHQPRVNVRHHCPMLVAQWQHGVTRVDNAERFSFNDFKENCGNLVIPADRFIHEVAFKLWKAPKYGA